MGTKLLVDARSQKGRAINQLIKKLIDQQSINHTIPSIDLRLGDAIFTGIGVRTRKFKDQVTQECGTASHSHSSYYY